MKISNMLIWVVAVMFGALVAQNSVAQSAEDPGVNPAAAIAPMRSVKSTVESRINRMTQQLALTVEQQAAITPIIEDEAIKLQALRSDTSLNPADHKTKLRELREATFNKIRPILSSEQQQKQDSFRKELLERRQKKDVKQPR